MSPTPLVFISVAYPTLPIVTSSAANFTLSPYTSSSSTPSIVTLPGVLRILCQLLLDITYGVRPAADVTADYIYACI